MSTTQQIKDKFKELESTTVEIPLMRKNQSFKAHLRNNGIEVSNFGTQNFLAWEAFEATIKLLEQEGGSAKKGDAFKGKLGYKLLSLNSVEGHLAYNVYDKKKGSTIFRRISPISAILVWAGLCKHGRGELILIQLDS